MSAAGAGTIARPQNERPKKRRLLAWTTLRALAAIAGLAALFLSGCRPGGPAPVSKLDARDYHSLLLAPDNPDVVFFGHHEGVLRSADGGRTWAPVAGLRQDAMSLAASRANPRLIYLAGHEVFMKSQDGGATWRHVVNNLPGLDLHFFAVDPDTPTRLYASAVGFGLFQSVDGGASWSRWDLSLPGSVAVTALSLRGGDQPYMLAGARDGVLYRSASGGAWAEVGKVDSTPVAFALNQQTGAVYLGTARGIYRSGDRGLSWNRLSLDTAVATLAVGGSPERVIVVSDKGDVYRSDDGGQTW